MSDKIIANLRLAIEVLSAIPEAVINLETFKEAHAKCGSTACAVGWLAQRKEFNEQGLFLVPVSNTDVAFHMHHFTIRDVNKPFRFDESRWQFGFVDRLFGERAFDRLFMEYGGGDWDQMEGWVYYNDDDEFAGLSHKELAIARLRKQLDLYERGVA